MARKQPRSGVGVRVLMGIARMLAAAVIAVAASAALADLDVRSVEFSRILPVVLTGEGIIYILMLGGGSVAAPVLLLSVLLGFAVRAGTAVSAGALSPQVSGDLLASSKFFYASYWPAAVVQVLMVAVGLRLIRPLIATRRRRMQRGRPQVTEALQDGGKGEERRDLLLEAIAEAPEEPPVSPTVLEERQIGDLAETVEQDLSDEEVEQALALPFEDEDEAEEPEPTDDEEAEEPEESLPPGVIDATPEAAARVAEEAEVPEETEAASAQDAELEPEPEVAEAAASPLEIAESSTEEPPPGEDTERLAPVRPAPAEAESGPAENLQGMFDVIAGAAGEGTDVRVWRTSDGRTVLAAVPSGTPAAGTGGHADALVSAHLEVCAWLGTEPTSQQLAATPIGAWALQSLDSEGGVILIMAGRGQAAAGRIQLAAQRAAESVRGMAEEAGTEGAQREPQATASALPLHPERALSDALNEAAADVGGRFVSGWRAWRGPHRTIIAAHAAPGADVEALARNTARLVAPIERFADAVALDGPEWMALAAYGTLLAIHWAQGEGERMVLAATVAADAAVGRVRWELGEVARRVAER